MFFFFEELKEVKNVNTKIKGIILALLVIGTTVTILTATQVSANNNEIALQDFQQNELQNRLQNRHRKAIQEGMRQTTGDCNCQCDGDSGSLKLRNQTRTMVMNQNCSNNQLRGMACYKEQNS